MGASTEALKGLERCDTHRCVEDIAVAYCFKPSATTDSCEAFIEALKRSSRQGERIFRLPHAAALGSLAGLVGDPQERDRLSREQRDTYQQLLRDNPNDAQALLGMAALTEDRKDRIALLKRAAAADPNDTFALRALAALSGEGSREEQVAALKHLRQAYERASPPHRWHLARDVYDQYTSLGMPQEATAFADSVLVEMGVDRAQQQLERALRHPDQLDHASALSALEVICDQNAIRIGDVHSCVQAIEALTVAMTAPDISRQTAVVDALSQATLTALSAVDPTLSSSAAVSRTSLQGSIQRLKEAGPETALLLYAQAHLLVFESSPAVAQQRTLLLERAVAIEPKNGEARGRLALEYMNQNRYSDAISQLETAIPLLPPHKQNAARSTLARALRAAGQLDRAEQVEQQLAQHD